MLWTDESHKLSGEVRDANNKIWGNLNDIKPAMRRNEVVSNYAAM